MNHNRYVYVVCAGERGEGHDPKSAWASLAEALDEAVRVGGARPTRLDRAGTEWKVTLANGCDEVVVRRLTMKGAAS